MLALDVNQVIPQFPEHRQGNEAPINVGLVLPIVQQMALEEQELIWILMKACALHEISELGEWRRVKAALDDGFFGSGADLFILGPSTQEKGKGINDDRFTRSGLPGQDIEAGEEFHGDLLDEGEVPDTKLVQHKAISLPT
jgi:hypothetical protein